MRKEKLQILAEDDNYLFVNKPSGLLTIPDRHDASIPSTVGELKKIYPSIYIVHRIDKDTSGCLVFAKNDVAHRHASILFENRQVQKKYLGLVHGTPPKHKEYLEDKIMEHPTIKGKMIVNAKQGKVAITEYLLLEKFKGYSLVEFTIHTGRMHQIRLHAANRGFPLLCDPIYGKTENIHVSTLNRKYQLGKYIETEQPILSRLALHSSSISFLDANNKTTCAEAPLFKDMMATLQQMRKWLS
jgi:23S rRNA pseudouridine1911/1915/1917 synthase